MQRPPGIVSRPLDGASRAPVRHCRTRRRRMTGDPGGSPDPLSVRPAGRRPKRGKQPLFGPVRGCVPRLQEVQSPCPSRRVWAGFGPLIHQRRDCLFSSLDVFWGTESIAGERTGAFVAPVLSQLPAVRPQARFGGQPPAVRAALGPEMCGQFLDQRRADRKNSFC